jgi:hypothetical protein
MTEEAHKKTRSPSGGGQNSTFGDEGDSRKLALSDMTAL